jgi:hypothetical protein
MVTVFTPDLTRVCEIDDIGTGSFQRAWYGAGTVQITINENTNYASQLQKDRIIMLDGDVYSAWIIESIVRKIGAAGAGSQIMTVTGREILSILDRRTIMPPTGSDYYTASGATETVLKTLISDHIGTTASAVKQVSMLTIATDQGRGASITINYRFKNLLEAVSESALATGIGIFMYLDLVNKKFVLECGASRDMTATQVFSTDLETIKDASLTDNSAGYKNLAIVAGQGEGRNRVIRTVYDTTEPTGLDRREFFVDARDLKLTTALDNRGAQKLSENGYELYLEASGLEYSRLNYQLGDLCKIRQFDLEQTVRITGITKAIQAGQYGITLNYDKFKPEITSQVGTIYSRLLETTNRTELPQDLRATDSPTFDQLTLTEATLPPLVVTSGAMVENLKAEVSDSIAIQGQNSVLKWKELTGTTDSTQGGIVSIFHGLTPSAIRIIESECQYGSGANYTVPENHTYSAGYQYQIVRNNTTIDILNIAGNSANILSQTITILIGYKE